MNRLASLAAAAFLALAGGLGPAMAQEPTPGHLAAAREVAIASGFTRTFPGVVQQLMNSFYQQVAQTRPEVVKDLQAVMAQLEPEFMKGQEELTMLSARIIARRMSEQELKDTAAFFNTPSGKKYVEAQPLMIEDMVAAMRGYTDALSVAIAQRVRVEMKKRGHDI